MTSDEPSNPREYVRTQIEKGHERVERAENLFEGGNYYRSYEEFENVIEYFESVLTLAIESGLEDERTEVDEIIRVCTRNAEEARRALYNIGDVKPELTTIEEFRAAETVNVFFSYNSDDGWLVKRIKEGIEDRFGGKIDIYIYEDDPQPGKPTWNKAKNRIRTSDLFLVLLRNNQDSDWVQQEVGFADEKVPIVPIVCESPEKPELKGALKGKEYLTFDQDDPDDFLEEFVDYAASTWDIGSE